MRDDPDKSYALECLKLANGDVNFAREMLAFVLGTDDEGDGQGAAALVESLK